MIKKTSYYTIIQWVVLLTYAAFCMLSVYAYTVTKQLINEGVQRRFQSNSQLITKNIASQLTKYEELLYSTRSWVLTTDQVDNEKWKLYFKTQGTFNTYPHLSSVALLDYSEDIAYQELQTQLREEYNDPSLTLDSNNNQKNNHVIVVAISSDNDLEDVIGQDYYFEQNRRELINSLLIRNAPKAGPQVKFLLGQQGYTVGLPVYKTNTQQPDNFIMLSFRTPESLEGLANSVSSNETKVNIIDTTDGNQQEEVLYQGFENRPDTMVRSDDITFASRNWRVEYQVDKGMYMGVFLKNAPFIILIFGLVISSIALFVALISLKYWLLRSGEEDK